MKKLNLPEFEFRLRKSNDRTEIFDEFRKKYIVLTPEEWVRQNLLKYLHFNKNIPKGLITVEKGLTLNQLKKRADILIYTRKGNPCMIVECKSPDISIDQNTFEQIARYNMTLKVDYLLVSNGLEHFCCKIDFENKSFSFLEDIPNFETLNH
ncbi:MAG: restriction endonuclease subunit R [Bacteroidetes bacterium HGW-Bacteroidetes-17]|jgi:hypothetical protein|nr:MAG: restriction endonuclease subunit R [Bacteroidetes bacterium HGW-Bacteroidetes-17]